MDSIATVNGQTSFTIKNLHPDSTYYAAVVARINGFEGEYANAISRRPNNGNCTGDISNNDLMIDSIVAPRSGRAFTSSAHGTNVPVIIRVRNLDDQPVSSFTLKYNINGGAFTEENLNINIPARSVYTHSFAGIDLSAPGTYEITAVVKNNSGSDSNPGNDTLHSIIRHLQNEPISLDQPLLENFETADIVSLQNNAWGIAGLSRWDYVNTDPLARLRTFVTPDIYENGQRGITLDVSKARPANTSPFNALIGTFNLSGYDVNNHEIRLSFRYKHHGFTQVPHPLNKVWARGNDTNEWIELFDLGVNQ
ncbi:MAG: fibronectin type III domain-containing protein, partial [Chitinophagaceae bacterium]|nr:fibronectin type III domain-containing protein [Chitinophagaceae bacterium]